MATTSYTTSSNETVNLWSRKLFREALKHTSFGSFLGKDSGSLIQLHDDLQKSAGDQIRTTLRMQLSADGVQGDSSLEGNEEALTTYTQDFVIDQVRHAVRSNGRMSDQRVNFSVREEARQGLSDWWADRFDTCFFNQLCGNNAQSDTLFTGNNATTAPDSNHYMNAETPAVGGASNDEDLDSTGDTFVLSLIDYCIERAQTLTPAIRPLMWNGEKCYVIFLHPYQVTDLRTNTSTGQWLDITKAIYQGKGESNPITKGFMNGSYIVGKYNQTYIISNSRCTQGVNSSTAAAVSNTRRAVFCGAQSIHLGFGRDNSPEKMTWVEEEFDYGNQLGVSAGCIFGMEASRWNSADFGKIVVSTYTSS